MRGVHKSCKGYYQASLWRCVNSRLGSLDVCQTWKGPTHILATEVEHLLCLLDASNETAGNGQPAKECHTISRSVAAHSPTKKRESAKVGLEVGNGRLVDHDDKLQTHARPGCALSALEVLSLGT